MWARVTAGQCELAVCCSANTTRENTVAMTREKGRVRWERGWSNDREAVLQLKKRRGFIHLQREEKEGIIDESAAYNFSAANQTSGEITLYSQ